MNQHYNIYRKFLFILFLGIMATAPLCAVSTGVHTFADNSALSSGTWIKIALNGTTDGIYQIPYSQLRTMGFSNPAQVGVFGFGGHMLDESFAGNHIDDLPEVATYHDAANQRILFYGRGLVSWNYRNETYRFSQRQHPYAKQACYFLHQKEETACVMDTLPIGTGNAQAVNVYDDYLLHEQENVNLGKNGRELYGESFLYTRTQDFSFSMEGIVASTALLSVNFAANSASTSSISVSLNSTVVGNGNISAVSKSSYAYANETTLNVNLSKYSEAVATDNIVRITYTPGESAATMSYLNYIRLQAKRALRLYDNFNLFRNRSAASTLLKYEIENYDATTMQVWDVTSPTDVKLQTLQEDGSFIPTQTGIREYALVNLNGNFTGVTSQGSVSNQNLHALPQTEMVIIVPRGLKSYAEELAAYRRSHDSLHVTVVTPDLIYNEFSSGVPDATAYRLFLKMFYDRDQTLPDDQQLQYLLLFGDGYYNNHAICNNQYYLLSYESDASLVETGACVSDDYFGFLDDNEGGRTDYYYKYTISSDVLDIGIGRFPVHSADEAEAVLAKTIAYSNNTAYGNWKNRLCFVGDDDDSNMHMIHADSMVVLLQKAGHDEFVYKKIYLSAYTRQQTSTGVSYPDAKKDFNEALQQGTLLINYSGHGSTSAIAAEKMMTTAEAKTLNMKYLPVWVTATCDFSRFDDDETSCGETLLLNANGGAAALFTTTRVVYAANNKSLNNHFINNVFNKKTNGTRYRLGDIMCQSKRAMGTEYNKLNFCLLGDPSLTLAYPEYEMELTAINGQEFSQTDANFSLPALSRVTMRGRVLKVGSSETDTTFNGLIYPSIFDAEETMTAVNYTDLDKPFKYKDRSKKIFTGRDVISNGIFEFSYIVPQDISYDSNCGLVNLYACSDDGREGQGYFKKLIHQGITDVTEVDTVGPVITALFLNQSDFKSGDVVNSTPYFFAELHDSTGFNTTGNSVGHDMIITLQSLSDRYISDTQYILNEYFTTYTGDPTTGNVRYSIPELADGEYQLTFRAFDVYNNATTATIRFVVRNATAPRSVVVQAYPSPATTGENITFRILHNRPESESTMLIQVYTQTGTKVWENETSTGSSNVNYVSDLMRAYLSNTALNSDETSLFVGSSSMTWNQKSTSGGYLAPGMYVYRVYMTCDGSTSASESKKLIIVGNNKSE